MNIDRYMVNLFFEIKRNLPHTDQRDLKISSPDLGPQLIQLFLTLENDALKRLIEVFFERAGEDWSKQLRSALKKQRRNEMLSRNMNAVIQAQASAKAPSKPKARYYRGALIES